ncbi:EAL domain, c-di-GMP-specific phosphodiesterase class I (or its enzymatically inactive variant) [Lachnospiraceae bacterium XBB1006]|nr:EAL domain, c-di-GMP-specific phosphodiesterase class I (or its enzymatically inactive variant) [Lachnospiraceae bacterium XBB1006]
MVKTPEVKINLAQTFTDRMSGGAFVYRAAEGHELLYANQNMVHLFECDTYEEFAEFVGNSFDGIVNASQLQSVQKEIDFQIYESQNAYDHIFYHIRTKKGNVRLVEDYGTLVSDEKEGDLFYVFVVSREFEIASSELDRVTGLYGKARFVNYVKSMNDRAVHLQLNEAEYAIVYINLVNFKLLNINKGIAEGDACLMIMAEILSAIYDDAFISRLSDDHFAIFTDAYKAKERTEAASRMFREKYGNRQNIQSKYGIVRFTPDIHFDVEGTLSQAKVACDFIKYDYKTDIVEYSEELAKQRRMEEYVLGKLDEALEKEWIQVYFQPVVRSLTQQLCGLESLARWIDTEVGFLPPGEFIETLEKNRKIHKLDCYVVEKVCEQINYRVRHQLPMVPVSVNFSWLDFSSCDMLSEVERCVEKYDVPRDFLHIEITESMIATDEALMSEVIRKFRGAGYEIWMDDFGSGYSSLTILKDYEFDMLKFDMRFLTPFTEKARDIVRSTTTMAKDIGIKTLAEGVETKEQLDFLRSIGCGKIQGYYYGKPEPIESMFAHLEEKKITIEKRQWRHFYDMASFYARYTESPLEIVEDNGTTFRTLFMNEAYRKQILQTEMSLEEIDAHLYRPGTALMRKYRAFADLAEESGNTETIYYTIGSNYLRFRARTISEYEGHHILKGEIYNITADQNQKDTERLDRKLRGLNGLFEVVHLLNVENESMIPLIGRFQYLDAQTGMDVNKGNQKFVQDFVYPSQREAYLEFLNPKTIAERVGCSKRGTLMKLFKIRQNDGSYQWREIYLMEISATGGKEYLFCIKMHQDSFQDDKKSEVDLTHIISEEGKEQETILEYANLWDNMVWNAQLKFFWKDEKRRFRGVSQSFLDFYGFKSQDEVIGKTDEEMGWHVDNLPYQNDEWEVLRNGKRVINALGQCIVRGVVHNIVANKMPVYGNGKIVGLVGYFMDYDEARYGEEEQLLNYRIDAITKLMSPHAFMDALIDYSTQFNEHNRNYGMIVLQNVKHDRITETLGTELGKKLLAKMGQMIVEVAGKTCAVTRVKESTFIMLTYANSWIELETIASKLKKAMEEIHEVDGVSVTIRVEVATKMRTDEGVTDENIYQRTLEKIMG